MSNDDFNEPPAAPGRGPDALEDQARLALQAFIEVHPESVFFSRQLEVQNEDVWYHWITNRALRELAARGFLRTETRQLKSGGSIHLMKNTLRYIEYEEFRTKIELCRTLGITPVFAVRMLPKSWIHELNNAGGFALILKYQLYPWAHRDLARRVRAELGLPVDAPRALEEGTMMRFLRWHESL